MVDDSDVGVRAQGGGAEPQRLPSDERLAALRADLHAGGEADAGLKGAFVLITTYCPNPDTCEVCND